MKTHLRTTALVSLMSLVAVALTGCYEVYVKTRVCEDVDAAKVRTVVRHGVTNELYNSAADAQEAVKAWYDQSTWTFYGIQGAGNTADYWEPKLGARAEMSEPALFSDSNNNRITAEWISFDESETGYPYWELNMRADTTSPVRPELAANLTWAIFFPTTWDYQVSPERFMSTTTNVSSGSCAVDTTYLQLTFAEQGEISPTVRLLPPWAPPESPSPDPEPVNEPQPDPVESETASPPEAATNPPTEELAKPDESATGIPVDEVPLEEEGSQPLEEATPTDLEGKIGVATTEISESVGLVEVDSQLLPAIAVGNKVIPAGTEVRIVGTFSQGVLVEQSEEETSGAFVWMWIGALALAAGIGTGIFLMIRRPKVPADAT